MGWFGDHGQLRWNSKEDVVQYIVAWGLEENQAKLDGQVDYNFGSDRGYIYPTVNHIAVIDGATIEKELRDSDIKLVIARNSTLNTNIAHASYYVAAVGGYALPTDLPAGRYSVADVYITAIPNPRDRDLENVPEAIAFQQEFELTISTEQTPVSADLQIYIRKADGNGWEQLDGTVAENSVTVKSKNLGTFLLTSSQKITKDDYDYRSTPALYQTIDAANAAIQAAKAATASAEAAVIAMRGTNGYKSTV